MKKTKIGESQVIDFFSTALRDELSRIYGNDKEYSIGNFSGSQDRKFADFFAGTDSSCVLIEFKELEREISDEQNKPLREKLCANLTEQSATESRGLHFIAYREPRIPMSIKLAPYVDVVCPLFGIGIPPLIDPVNKGHDSFIEAFLSGKEGGSFDTFAKYVGQLSQTAGSTLDGLSTPFKAVLYSRNMTGKVVGTIFQSLGELKELMKKKPSKKQKL